MHTTPPQNLNLNLPTTTKTCEMTSLANLTPVPYTELDSHSHCSFKNTKDNESHRKSNVEEITMVGAGDGGTTPFTLCEAFYETSYAATTKLPVATINVPTISSQNLMQHALTLDSTSYQANAKNFLQKNSLAKLNWWHAPTPTPIKLNKSIEAAVAKKVFIPLPPAAVIAKQEDGESELFLETLPKNNSLQTVRTSCNNGQSQNKTPTSAPFASLEKGQKLCHHHSNPVKSTASGESIRKVVMDPSYKGEDYQAEDQMSQDSKLLIKDAKPYVGLLNADEEDEMQVSGYRRSQSRTLLCWLCICLTGGLLRLILHWWRHWYLIATHEPCSLEEAEKVLVQENYQGKHNIFYVKTVQCLNANDLKQQYQRPQQRDEKQDIKAKSVKDDADISALSKVESVSSSNFLLSLHFSAAQFKKCESVRFFNCKQLRYAWDNQTQSFLKLRGLDENVPSAYLHQQRGLAPLEQMSRRFVYGPNEITIPYKNIKTLLFLEALNPFYVFQIFSVVLWFTYDYYYYACVILLMSIFGITMTVLQTKKNQDALRQTVQNTGKALVVDQKGDVQQLQTSCLVPGDIIEIPTDGCTMQCDAVLLSGNCILDESMLTGESVPVTKTPLPVKRDMTFDKKEHARHTLFCGTKVIQTRYIGSERVLAIVINTGNITAKGGLIRSILYPPPVDYKFEQDSYKFIECLALIALIGFIYTLVTKIMRDIDTVKIAVESLDLITIVVPPALPAAMTVGRFYAQKRLEKNNIYCISPRSINVAGSINCCCFDKTGTLTEDGLDMWGVVPKSATNTFQIPIKQIERLPCDNFLFAMVTCHSITIMNGKMMGDPLDLKMFESTGWTLEDPKNIPDSQKFGLIHPTIVRQPKKSETEEDATFGPSAGLHMKQRQSSVDDLLADVGLLNGESNNDHGIVREFPFTSNLQRMSVITRRLSERNFNVYCKGSPEMLQQLCVASSLPENYSQQLAVFAKQGYRVIALAYKPLSSKVSYTKTQRLARESVESDLEFLGFVVLENRLKPDTTEVIQSLSTANIRTIMVTGDNILTAVSVARDCGIVKECQAVVTVNVRLVNNEKERGREREQTEFELYYTLELGSSNAVDETLINMQKSKKIGNGDLGVLQRNKSQVTLPHSIGGSLSSVQTCDTWTHQDQDIELGKQATHIPESELNKVGDHREQFVDSQWRQNYCFAMVGRTWHIVREHFPDELRYFLTRGAIFARMSPEQKQCLIMELQNIDYCVAMCGDGANDCGALKVAHTGISLSETESSIASPFTSREPTVACVPKVIREGRAALVTSFGIFKYMAAYSMVQFVSVMILYSIDSNLTDKQYLYIDLGLISIFAFFFGKTEAYDGALCKQVPLSSLISLTPLASLLLHLIVVVAFQVTAWFQVHQQTWFVPFNFKDENHLGCYENYAMFAVSSFQYLVLAFVFSKGAPYRKQIWSNIPFCLALLVNLIIIVYLTVYPATWVANFFQLIVPPEMSFRYVMCLYGVLCFVTHVFVEACIIELLVFKRIQIRRERNLQTAKQKYAQVEYELQCYHKNWPRITVEGYDTFQNERREEHAGPTYIEISAEQNFESPPPNNKALNNFFGIEHNTAAATQTPTSIDIATAKTSSS